MAEGFDPSEAPTARGRRNPQIAEALLADDDNLAGAGESTDQAYFGLIPGDMVMAKVTFAADTQVGDAWYTYGVQTRVLDNETEEAAFERVAETVNGRVLHLADDFVERLATAIEGQQEQARETARTNRIVPRQ